MGRARSRGFARYDGASAGPDWRWRLVDADSNRACEGLRALEDAARFVLGEPAAAERLRDLRQAVRRLVAGHGDRLLEARDAVGDPGGPRSLAGPPSRELEEYLAANAKRVQEALRVLEEALGTGTGRMEVYDLERLLVGKARRLALRGRVAGLFALLDASSHARPLATLRRWLKRGLKLVELRDKRSRAEASALAHEAARLCRAADAVFIVNDDPALALACGADGVHLGAGDLPAADARKVLGPLRLIGRTVRGPEEARVAESEGADYVAVGRLFASATKPGAPEVGVKALMAVRAAVSVPVVGIGGITAANIAEVYAAGAHAAAAAAAVGELLALPETTASASA